MSFIRALLGGNGTFSFSIQVYMGAAVRSHSGICAYRMDLFHFPLGIERISVGSECSVRFELY